MGRDKKRQPTSSPEENFSVLEKKLEKVRALVNSGSYDSAANFIRLLFSDRSYLIANLDETAKTTARQQLGDLIYEIEKNQPSLFFRNEPGAFYQEINYSPKPEIKPEPVKLVSGQTLEQKVEAHPTKTEAVKPQPADFNLPEAYSDFITQQNFSPDILKLSRDRHPASDDLLTVRISGNSLNRYSRFFNSNRDTANLVNQRLWNLLKHTFDLTHFRYVSGSSDYFPFEVNKKNFKAFKTALPVFYQTLQGLHQHFNCYAKPRLSPEEKNKLLYEVCLYLDMHTPGTITQPAPFKEEPNPEPPKPKELDLNDYDPYLKEKGFVPNQDIYQRKYTSFPLELVFDHENKTIRIPSKNLSLLSSHFSEEQKKEFDKRVYDFLKKNFQPFDPQEEFSKNIDSFDKYWTLKINCDNQNLFAPALESLIEKADSLYHHLHLYLSPGLADPVTTEKYQRALSKFALENHKY